MDFEEFKQSIFQARPEVKEAYAKLLEEIDQCLGEALAADVVKVPRCRECKNRNHDGDGKPWCDAHMGYVPDLDFFCRDGRL